MSGRKKYEPERIAAALKLLRALPVKDNRKTTSETLHMLKGGIFEALEKGYDRTEIRKLIAPEVPVSSTTFNDFLAENLKGDTPENGKEADAERKNGGETPAKDAGQTGNAPAVKPEGPVATERKSASPENGNQADANRKSGNDKPAREAEQTGNAVIVKPESPAAAERKAATQKNGNEESVKQETPTTETRASAPAPQTEPRKLPSYFTPDLPDSEL